MDAQGSRPDVTTLDAIAVDQADVGTANLSSTG
jgi:hypothetical protein